MNASAYPGQYALADLLGHTRWSLVQGFEIVCELKARRRWEILMVITAEDTGHACGDQ